MFFLKSLYTPTFYDVLKFLLVVGTYAFAAVTIHCLKRQYYIMICFLIDFLNSARFKLWNRWNLTNMGGGGWKITFLGFKIKTLHLGQVFRDIKLKHSETRDLEYWHKSGLRHTHKRRSG